MSDPAKTSSLEKISSDSGSISLRVVTDLGMIDLRGDLKSKGFKAAVKKATGCALCDKPRSSSQAGDVTILWLSVDQWLILCPQNKTADLLAKLTESLKNIHSLVVDLSDARTIIRLQGEGAREVLMKGTPVDLTVSDYGPGSVRRLRFGENAAMVHIRSLSPEIIDLYVFRSYAFYTWRWLEETSKPQSRLKIFTKQAVVPT